MRAYSVPSCATSPRVKSPRAIRGTAHTRARRGARGNTGPTPPAAATCSGNRMRLASYLADGRPSFGVVTGDGVVTMNGRLRRAYRSLREALASGTLDEMREIANAVRPDRDF